jgi:hypothetical protein
MFVKEEPEIAEEEIEELVQMKPVEEVEPTEHIYTIQNEPVEEIEEKSHSQKLKDKRKQKDLQKRIDSGQQLKCNVCNATFESRSKLFEHLKEEGHEKFVEVKKKKK